MDGDSFRQLRDRAQSKLEGRPVGGRRAARRWYRHRGEPRGQKYGVKTCMACFEAARLCPSGVMPTALPGVSRNFHQMFRVLEQYSPTLLPVSIDEGFLDFTTMDRTVWRNTTPADYVQEISQRIKQEVRIPVSAGLANSSRLAKLATDAPSRVSEIKPGEKKISEGSLRARPFRSW